MVNNVNANQVNTRFSAESMKEAKERLTIAMNSTNMSTNASIEKVHISHFDSLTISDEARQRAAEGGALTWEESVLLSLEARRAAGHEIPEYVMRFSGATEPAEPHLHNLGGRMEITAGNGQPLTVILRDSGIWIANGHNPERSDFNLIDPSRGTPGIPQSTIRVLEFTLRIIQNIDLPEGEVLIDPNGDRSKRENLELLFGGFSTLRQQLGINPNSNQHAQAFEDAMRTLLRNFFAETVRIDNLLPEGSKPSEAELQAWAEKSVIQHNEALAQADVFADVFFANFRTHGMEAAFNTAWAAI